MIPLATTTVTLRRTGGGADPYEPDDLGFVATGVAAHVDVPAGAELVVGGRQEDVNARLLLGPTPVVVPGDDVDDDTTGECWRVTWVRRRTGLGLDHQVAGLRAVKGAATSA